MQLLPKDFPSCLEIWHILQNWPKNKLKESFWPFLKCSWAGLQFISFDVFELALYRRSVNLLGELQVRAWPEDLSVPPTLVRSHYSKQSSCWTSNQTHFGTMLQWKRKDVTKKETKSVWNTPLSVCLCQQQTKTAKCPMEWRGSSQCRGRFRSEHRSSLISFTALFCILSVTAARLPSDLLPRAVTPVAIHGASHWVSAAEKNKERMDGQKKEEGRVGVWDGAKQGKKERPNREKTKNIATGCWGETAVTLLEAVVMMVMVRWSQTWGNPASHCHAELQCL